MPNPKAARVKRVVDSEVRSAVDTFTDRLRILGATPEEVQVVRDNWDVDTDDWNDRTRGEVAHLSDDRLVRMLEAVRAEYPFEPDHTVPAIETNPGGVVMGVEELSPPPPPGSKAENRPGEAPQGAQEPPNPAEPPSPSSSGAGPQEDAGEGGAGEPPAIDAPIHELEAWVGDDPDRARLVLNAEQQDAALNNQEPRKTLIAKMERVIEAGADAGS